jgi:K+-transporting ATPase KdpF subunit
MVEVSFNILSMAVPLQWISNSNARNVEHFVMSSDVWWSVIRRTLKVSQQMGIAFLSLVILSIFVYLFYALFRPEKF